MTIPGTYWGGHRCPSASQLFDRLSSFELFYYFFVFLYLCSFSLFFSLGLSFCLFVALSLYKILGLPIPSKPCGFFCLFFFFATGGIYSRGQQTPFVKGEIVNILGFIVVQKQS